MTFVYINRPCIRLLLFLYNLASDSTSQLALNALLKRCEEVLLKYADDERLSGNCPLPRSRMNEVSLVLKSVTVLISSLKEAQKTSVANSELSNSIMKRANTFDLSFFVSSLSLSLSLPLSLPPLSLSSLYYYVHVQLPVSVDPGIWHHVGELFPALVQCVTCTSLDVRQALKEALSQFSDLMQPFPSPKPSMGSR